MEAPEISTLDEEEDVSRVSPPPTHAIATASATASGPGPKRVSKIKLRMPERRPQDDIPESDDENPRLEPPPPVVKPPDVEDEEDQLIDDDLDIEPGPSAAKPKRVRNRKKASAPTLKVPAVVSQDAPPPVEGEGPAYMMSAWQAEVPPTVPPPPPPPAGGEQIVDSAQPSPAAPPLVIKAKKKPQPKKPTPVPMSTKPKRASARKVEESYFSAGEGTPQPYNRSSPVPESVPREITAEDARLLAESGQLATAPLHPLPTRPFPVQPLAKQGATYATSGPLDRTNRRPRKWKMVKREVKTIAGGRWIAKTWTGERESQLSIPSVIPLAKDDTSKAGASTSATAPSKPPKIKFIHSSSSKAAPAVSSPLAARGHVGSPPPELYGTREPSLDTEMLSLAEPDHDVSHAPMREVDVEMELLGE